MGKSEPHRYATAVTIAGLDPSGGAGMLADVKTFSALGVYGAAVATAVTVQNTMGVSGVQAVNPDIVAAQIDAVMDDLCPDAVKTGMLNDCNTIEAVADTLQRYDVRWLVVDPVMVATSGDALMRDDAVETFLKCMLPLATLLTPNLPEACRLTGRSFQNDITVAEAEAMGRKIMDMGAKAVLVKGGHREGNAKNDLYVSAEGTMTFSAETVATRNTHGTGCTLSAAIAAELAIGRTLPSAIDNAKRYLTQALVEGSDVAVGHGAGGVNHFFSPHKLIKK